MVSGWDCTPLCDVLATAGHGWVASEDCQAAGLEWSGVECDGLAGQAGGRPRLHRTGKKRLFVFVIQTRQATALLPHTGHLKVFSQRPPFSEELVGFS